MLEASSLSVPLIGKPNAGVAFVFRMKGVLSPLKFLGYSAALVVLAVVAPMILKHDQNQVVGSADDYEDCHPDSTSPYFR